MKNIADIYKLSPRQRELVEHHAVPGSRVEHLCLGFGGTIDETEMRRAAHELVARHAVLRTAVFSQGLAEPQQVVRQAVEPIWQRRSAGTASLDASLAAFLEAEPQSGMKLSVAPLVRFAVLQGDERGVMIMSWHQGILDQDSARACMRELLARYEALRAGLEAPAVRVRPFRDYIAWLEGWDQTQAAHHVRSMLGGSSPTLLGDEGRKTRAPGPYLVQQVVVPGLTAADIQTSLRQQKISLATLIQGAWAVLLRSPAGGAAVFGVAVSGRAGFASQDEAIVGRFAGLVPRRIDVPKRGPVTAWLRQLEVASEAGPHTHTHASADQLRTWLGLAAGAALWHSAVAVEDRTDDPLVQQARRLGFDEPAHVSPDPDGPLLVTATLHRRLSLTLRYDPHRLPSTLIARTADALAGVIARMLTQPDHQLGLVLQAAQHARTDAAAESRIEPGSGFGPAEIEVVLAQHRFVRRASVSPDGPAGSLAVHIVPTPEARAARTRPMAFSLFYFADASSNADKYRIYLEGARFGDRNGFSAIWTPERHFHENGGLYPNPSVLSAALATITERVQLRAGSVVLPLHHPLRVAEEWSVVDNLSRGRVAIAAASGWVPNDFVFTPGIYERRRDVMFELIDQVQRLWRGEALPVQDGVGKDAELRIFPRPVQPELPIWLTCAGNPDTFEQAGLRGHNVLTSMLAQSLDDATAKIALFRSARARAGHDPDTGIATMMLHTFLGPEHDRVIDLVREPFTRYLRSHVSLMQTLVKSLDMQIDINEPTWLDYLASFAFERYQRTSALIGTPTSCVEMVDRLSAAGVDELACLIDFGVDVDQTLAGLVHLAELKRLVEHRALYVERVLAEHVAQRLPLRLPPLRFHIADA